MSQKRTAIYYKDLITGKEPAKLWLDNLKYHFAQAKIFVRIQRAEDGNFGNTRSVGHGVWELKIPAGPGYRVYYALDGNEFILLLFGGNKSTQSKDIMTAKKYWDHHKEEVYGKRK
jgi:putative addiction module killer protein